MPIPIKGSISGSRSAAVLGLSKYTSPFSVWQSIQEDRDPGFNARNGYDYEPFEGNASTRWGHAFEDAVCTITEQKIGKKIIDREKVHNSAHHPTYKNDFPGPYSAELSCHIDGRFSRTKILLENKTANERAYRTGWGETDTELIPRDYHCQVQHNMYLAGLDEAIVSVLVFPKHPQDFEDMGWETVLLNEKDGLYNLTFKDEYRIRPIIWAQTLSEMGYHHIYRIKRNEKLIKSMLEKYQEFWERFVLPGIPPEPMDLSDIKKLCPNPCGTVVIDDKFILDCLNEYSGIMTEISSTGKLGKRKEQLKTAVLDRVRELPSVKDDESTEKWVFRDTQGNKLGSWGKDKRGYWIFRT